MEAHPIPQNVTSFQFKLVGDMTLKQFGYLAIGLSIAYICFVFLAPYFPLIAWPLVIFSASSGAAFAFLPIADRPLDYWVVAFLKAVYSPTKRAWKKNDKYYTEDSLFKSRALMYLSAIPTTEPNERAKALSPNPLAPLQAAQAPTSDVSRPTLTPPPPQAAPAPSDLPTQEELAKTVEFARQAQILQTQIIETERQLNKIKQEAQKPTEIPVDYTEQVNSILDNLQRLVSQASEIKEKIANLDQPENGAKAVPQPTPKQTIRVVSTPRPKPIPVLLTTFPNIINGVVTDANNNLLEGVVVVIYDKEGLPVRALKTNKLGQFSGATPLPNGTYTIELEKDEMAFDTIQTDLSGQVLQPLNISAKKLAVS